MKRICIAIFMLSICITICVTEQVKVRQVHNDIDVLITQCYQNTDKIDDLKNYWSDNKRFVYLVNNHDIPDDLDSEIMALQIGEQTKNALANAKALNDLLYGSEKISIANII